MPTLHSIFSPLERYTLPIPMIQLEHSEPIARGRSRLIYDHPENAGLLIKLPIIHKRTDPTFRTLRRKLRPSGYYKAFIKELLEYRRLVHHSQKTKLPIPALHGLVRTSHGLGRNRPISTAAIYP